MLFSGQMPYCLNALVSTWRKQGPWGKLCAIVPGYMMARLYNAQWLRGYDGKILRFDSKTDGEKMLGC